jgi:signal transduction histidine kinase/CheY-like chemotaxis protein
MDEINKQEKQISKQKEKLQKQIELSEDQNMLIHKQTVELEKNRHSLEKKVELRTNELLEAKEKAEESDRLKTAFLENISHEIRTPMNAIMGFSSLLGFTNIKKEDQLMYVERINKNCQMLLHLIDGIIDMSKIQAGQMVIIKSIFSVNRLFNDLRDELLSVKEDMGNKDVKINLILPKHNVDFQLYSDSIKLKQIINNLLNNALKYTEKGTIKFGYVPLYDSNYDKEPSQLQFFVEDTGIGISAEKSDYIFNWFNKIEDDNSKIYRGAGLGLYLSKELVDLLGGHIWFNSKVDEGSTFYFTLPYLNTTDVRSDKQEKVEAKRILAVEEYDWRNQTILIVEDEQNNIIYLSEIIRKTGAKVLTANNGKKALERIKDNPKVSLILMDLMMPEMNGYEATREIRKMKLRLPIIAQTAYTNAREQEKSLAAGCDGYISKPYNPPELLKLIDKFV